MASEQEYLAIWLRACESQRGILLGSASAGRIADTLRTYRNTLMRSGALPPEARDFIIRPAPWSPDNELIIVRQRG